jgi:hypothetical protein
VTMSRFHGDPPSSVTQPIQQDLHGILQARKLGSSLNHLTRLSSQACKSCLQQTFTARPARECDLAVALATMSDSKPARIVANRHYRSRSTM